MMNFNVYNYREDDSSLNHKFDMIIKYARHYKRKRKMRIPYQYRKVDSFIDEMDILAYAICTNRNKDTNFSAGRIKRINEQNAKELKVLRNKIKHQTRCTFERVYALMHFEDEM